MQVMVDVCVIPIGVGVSVSRHVAACQQIFDDAGLNYQMHAYGTNVEGSWDEVMNAIRQCHEIVHEMGAPRISTTIRLGTRSDRHQTMQDKLDSVNRLLKS
ncbi:MAG: MTH1187 family thiamine-binding protein [Pseudomonadota bacterium]